MSKTSCAFSFAAGLGLGAVAMYFADPRIGRRRRALVRDKTYSIATDVQHYAMKKARHWGNIAKGTATEAGSAFGVRSDMLSVDGPVTAQSAM